MKMIFSIFFIFLSVFCVYADIIYTDVVPDTTLRGNLNNPWAQYYIDLNQDGTKDFILTHFYPSNDLYYTEFQSFNPQIGEIMVDEYEHPLSLDYGIKIDQTQSRWKETSSFAIYVRDNWKGRIDKYLGVRIKIGNNWLYGWIRIDIPEDESYCVLKDFACELEFDKAINAGEIGNTSISFNNNENNDLPFVLTKFSNMIFLNFRDNEINLKNKYEAPIVITIYNIFGQCVYSEYINPNTLNLEIDIENLAVGNYFIKILNFIGKFVKM